jgi:hypothetical protein
MLKIETVAIDRLKLDSQNARKHGKSNLKAIVASLKRFRQQKPVVVDKDFVVRAGNGTVMAAKELGWKTLEVHISDLSASELTAFAIADNRTAELADWDDAVLAAALKQCKESDDALLAATGFNDDQLAVMVKRLNASNPPDMQESEVVESAASRCKPGEVWQLGRHRLMCGDSTSQANLETLLTVNTIDFCFTSPPYNSHDGGYRTDYKSRGTRKRFYKDNVDKRTEDEWVQFCDSVMRLISGKLTSETSPVVWNVMYTAHCRSGYGKLMFAGSHGLSVKETICWDKGNGFPSASRGILSRNWELVFVLSKGDKYDTHQGINESRWAKWDISRPAEQHAIHRATFPVELASRAIQEFCTGQNIYEPFAGTGTTLIAAEQLNKTCYAMELSAEYCDIIIDRWEKMTSQTAKKVTQ